MPLDHPDAHSHSAHAGPPLTVLNETEVLLGHVPDPLSYWAHDFESPELPSYQGFMVVHVVGMSLAFFGCLPAAISLRIANSPWRSPVVIAFNVLVAISVAASTLYKKLTPDLYEGSKHGLIGYVVVILASIIPIIDAFDSIKSLITALRNGEKFSISLIKASFLDTHAQASEYTGLNFHDEPEEYETAALRADDEELEKPRPRHERQSSSDTFVNDDHHHHKSSRMSITSEFSESTARDSPTMWRAPAWNTEEQSPKSLVARVAHSAFIALERLLIFGAFIALQTGAVTYTGICRENYINGCLAHLIKGGIFWSYGLISFGRYLGAFADKGWAWNRAPRSTHGRVPVSAEFIESFVIFIYGITNTWMERFGAEPGSPFTSKQVQHISIAVMFWFAGLVGMAIETKTFRNWLASSALSSVKPDEQISEPHSYVGSFNPFPALVVGVTGIAMAAHHQTYLFQVQIHTLWGNFLAAFAVLRSLTYFFLWLRPSKSILPSRPPTEALASFFLTAGGLTFIFSTEQITFMAMRRGHDDVMMFLNVAVAITCLAFCWVLSISAFKGWVMFRSRQPMSV
ncbi:hypothetical protein SISNIDRAFT_405165 [Sistotremastrum niveocremeum HHB9708]|uniref:Uncharacterized protein n=1 Tax=Sistotremastrum niveocremeum HHB9708 TaxID=1314777 RepID=A0A164Z4C5_9AGAM|nr:hypothetical protein SISNIDRAFT_405165 [Sistotremastrum niveocremeum HHB9708]